MAIHTAPKGPAARAKANLEGKIKIPKGGVIKRGGKAIEINEDDEFVLDGKGGVRVNKGGRPRSGKVPVTLRLDPEVLAALQSFGPGWQPKTNELLREWLKL